MDLTKSLLNAAIDNDLSGVKTALENGADVNARGNDGGTVLMSVSYGGHTEIAKMLIENNADVNAKDNNDWIALKWASQYGHTEIVSLLKKADAKK